MQVSEGVLRRTALRLQQITNHKWGWAWTMPCGGLQGQIVNSSKNAAYCDLPTKQKFFLAGQAIGGILLILYL
jgi:hypothetical protein